MDGWQASINYNIADLIAEQNHGQENTAFHIICSDKVEITHLIIKLEGLESRKVRLNKLVGSLMDKRVTKVYQYIGEQLKKIQIILNIKISNK